jgi:hypothetical protein
VALPSSPHWMPFGTASSPIRIRSGEPAVHDVVPAPTRAQIADRHWLAAPDGLTFVA